ncbi:MAG: nitroreductase family deazaflavin-dependent oxidoreductase [Anaerolineae bacterium]|nr:nitroreductase family deazaflavin-dependent oxidoreductase [Anaerolineae bacterium]
MMGMFQQREGGFMIYPRSRWLKRMTKFPILLWRLGLGPILGQIFMLLTTTGRKSGLPRRTVIEYHVVNGRVYAPCAFGPKADWYRNIVADPHVTVQTARGMERMIATRVTDDQELLAVYEALHRSDPFILDSYLRSLDIRPDPDDIVAKKDRIYWLRFDPTDEPTPPPQEVDLAWLWPLALLVVIGMCWASRGKRPK